MSELKKQLRCDAQKLIRACLAAAEPSAGRWHLRTGAE